MKKNEIVVGGKYTAKVSGKLTTVRVDAVRHLDQPQLGGYRGRNETVYDVTNLATGRKTTFHSAAKFRSMANVSTQKIPVEFNQTWSDLAKHGICDTMGGAEYTRVLKEWLQAGQPPDITSFIKSSANRAPEPLTDSLHPEGI